MSGVYETPASTVELVFILLSTWSVFGLTGMHCYLVLANMTTNESIKNTFVSQVVEDKEDTDNPYLLENPFTLGSAYLNCQSVLCSSRPPTRLRKVPH